MKKTVIRMSLVFCVSKLHRNCPHQCSDMNLLNFFFIGRYFECINEMMKQIYYCILSKMTESAIYWVILSNISTKYLPIGTWFIYELTSCHVTLRYWNGSMQQQIKLEIGFLIFHPDFIYFELSVSKMFFVCCGLSWLTFYHTNVWFGFF